MIREKTSTLPKWRPAYVIHLALAVTVTAAAAGPQAAVPQSDSSFIDANGTAHVTRVVPVPKTLSPAAQKILARQVSDAIVPETLAQRRSKTDTWQARAGAEAKQLYPVNISDGEIAGVEVRLVTPLEISAGSQDRVLINLHGGGFNSDSGSLTETIPIANLTLIRVIAVLYRLAPEHPFPAAVDDAVAVYQEVLKTHKPENVGLYGTSAGAILTSEVAVKLRQLRIPMPGAMGVFSGNGDFSKYGDSSATYGLNGFSGPLQVPGETLPDSSYVGATDRTDPVLSPVYADLKGFPPTLFVTSTRDLLLSGTTTLHRAFLRGGVDAELVVFEALPHAFWNNAELPESKEADQIMAAFFEKHLTGAMKTEIQSTSR